MIKTGRRRTKVALLTSSSLANKGDALMLESVVKRLGSDFRYAIPSNCAFASPRAARRFLICLNTDRPAATLKHWIFNMAVAGLNAATASTPRVLRESAHVLRDEDIDIAVDVSGYCYGDHWGEALLVKATRQYARYRARGVPVILMPKTWGPFTRIPKDRVNTLIENVDLAFARDKKSLSHLTSCLTDQNLRKVHFAPDYTHELGPRPDGAERRTVNGGTVYIIPSFRVIDSGALEQQRYYELLTRARNMVLSSGAVPVLLIHEALADRAFIEAGPRMGFSREHIRTEEDPTKLKEVIASGTAVITSRLHGLYNALNSCVPVAVIPWNFKYEEALKQYHCEELLVDMSSPEDSLDQKIELILSPAERTRLTATMSARREALQALTDEMWAHVERVAAKLAHRTTS